MRPTTARIDTGAIVSNYRLLCRFAGEGKVCAVVKADAYGHGAGPVANALARAGCRRFAVSSMEEGVELRALGVSGHVLLLFGLDPSAVERARTERLTPMVSSLGMLKGIIEATSSASVPFPLHLDFDTGMGRTGISPADAGTAVEMVRAAPGISVEGVSTHFARAGESREFTRLQLDRFEELLRFLRSSGIDTGLVHAANSAACLSEPSAIYGGVRAGIALYGAHPEPSLPGVESLIPALEWTSRITLLRSIPAGTPLSYGGIFTTSRPSLIATVPVGYADGYRRALSNMGGCVLIRGHKAPVVGRVCMDLTLVDVTDLPGVSEGDEVVLIGKRGGKAITVEDMAGWLGTINYEILCGIGKRVPRAYQPSA